LRLSANRKEWREGAKSGFGIELIDVVDSVILAAFP
jgi:hypothetical protein